MSGIEGRVSFVVSSSRVLYFEQCRFVRTMVSSWEQSRSITRIGGSGLLSWINSSDTVLVCGFR